MPEPELIQLIVTLGIFVLLGAIFINRAFLPAAYLGIIIMRPGIYYPILENIRFELIVAVVALMMILLSGESSKLLSTERSKILRYMFFFALVIAVSMLQAFSFIRAWGRVYEEILPNCLLVSLILICCRDKKGIRILLWSFVIFYVYLGYEPIYKYLTGDVIDSLDDFNYAIADKGLAAGHVGLAHRLCVGGAICWYLAGNCKNILRKSVGFLVFGFCLTVIIISGSRGGFVGIIIMFLMMSFFSKRPVKMLIVGFTVIFLMLNIMGGSYLKRMGTLTQVVNINKLATTRIDSDRLDGLIHGIEMMIKRPVLGVGPGCYPLARKAWFGWSLWSHNHYGQLAGELGLAGIIIWYLFAREYLGKCWKIRETVTSDPWVKAIATAILVASGVRLGLGMFDHSVYKFMWYMLASVIIVVDELNTKETIQTQVQC